MRPTAFLLLVTLSSVARADTLVLDGVVVDSADGHRMSAQRVWLYAD